MNYHKIYQKLMAAGKGRKKSKGLERHHIIPFSMGGLNKKENFIYFILKIS